MDKAQNSLEKKGDGTKRAYSREEVEALRFVNLESQQKKWIEIYCGLAPIVAGEYDGLIACNHQQHIQINFDPRKQFGKKKKTPAVLGEDCFQVMNNETENMIPLDPSCGEDYSILEGECSEEDDSDDDYSSIQRPAFLVTGKPNFNSGPPQDGLEYLRRVRWEAAQIPKVKVSKLETSKLSKEQTVYMPKIPDIAKCPEHLLLLKQWEDAFIADFSELRLMSRPKPPSKALVPSSSKPNQLIVPPPLESITQSHSLEIVNRYQTLGNIHRPDYSSALASDPFASGHSVSVTPFPVNPIKPSRSEYTNSHVTNLFYKEPSHPKNQTINEIAKFHFGSGCHFTLLHPEKTLSYYKDILLHHHSILIKSIQDRTYAYKILYHSIYIHNIVSMAEWGNPNQLRGLPGHSIQYNYHDYVDAWFKIFLYQNENFSHSWFISFDQKFKSEIPTWFLRWWTHYGAISDILPIDLSKIINYFASVYPFTTYQQQFPLLLIFISKYKIPWIFKWHYGIDDNIIIRQHTVKWWVKFNVPRILEIVQEEFPPDQCAPTPALTKAQQNPTAAISQGSQPSLSPVNLGSPSSSGSKPKSKSKAVAAQPAQSKPKSKSKVKSKPISPPAQPKIKSRSISKSSKEDMIQLAHQLLNQAKTQSTDSDSSEEGSEHAHSSEESTNQCSGPEFQDAQDPFA
ncbi:uncharacterized protein LOC114299969 isoform X1 [Camellia sinensis]|uniref:uncharacterized protein LOC114299969 isoform X1 n=2 Tax=Camellia sinensis TaxID=4442 RepID=UPI001036F065|nr:uncharacterized protein LOC114299969 isoform X1 [Camellia sinensis]